MHQASNAAQLDVTRQVFNPQIVTAGSPLQKNSVLRAAVSIKEPLRTDSDDKRGAEYGALVGFEGNSRLENA